MMQRIHRLGRSIQVRKHRTGLKSNDVLFYGARLLNKRMLGNMLVQRAPCMHIDKLQTTTDPKRRDLLSSGSAKQSQFIIVSSGFGQLGMVAELRSVAARGDIVAAGQQQPVEFVDRVARIKLKWQKDRNATGSDHCPGIVGIENIDR
jgi:hypothetical protein